MTTKEKGDVVGEIMDKIMKADATSPTEAMFQVPRLLLEMGEIIERVWHNGREIGFKDGFAEAKKQYERKLGKLN